MSIKLEAAYHEAGHVVVAAKSKYHNIVDGINLANFGQGDTSISVDTSKCRANGKNLADAAQATRDKDIAKESSVIFMAGYQAELIAESKNPDLKANKNTAVHDYEISEHVLTKADCSKKLGHAEENAKQILLDNWNLVETIAAAAFSQSSLSFDELHELLSK